MQRSPLEQQRAAYRPRVPRALAAGIGHLDLEAGAPSQPVADADEIREQFPTAVGAPGLRFVEGDAAPLRKGPLAVGVVLSGGQAPGGHNVIAGIYDGLKEIDPASRLYGFLGGPKGIFTGIQRELDAEAIDAVRNTGGFDLIRSGRDKIETEEQLEACRKVCAELELDGLVIIGGDDSNTNAAVLAEHFASKGSSTRVIGVPKTIDGDLRAEAVEMSFGFDTATKVYSELIGNICRDARSAGKYWHFIKLMGRSASHVTLECALRTQPNLALIGEEVQADGTTLESIAAQVVDVVKARKEAGRNYGVCLVPEGLIEFIPEMRVLIDEINHLLADGGDAEPAALAEKLSDESARVFRGLPRKIQEQLLADRDSHGNVQVSLIETESLLIETVRERLGGGFKAHKHFFGYEGRCSTPSNFDADYTYTLGRIAPLLVAFDKTGYMCAVANLSHPVDRWEACGVPLTSLMNMETRHGHRKPVIKKALVELDSPSFTHFRDAREGWQVEDRYLYPGPIQLFGPPEVTDEAPRTMVLDRTGKA